MQDNFRRLILQTSSRPPPLPFAGYGVSNSNPPGKKFEHDFRIIGAGEARPVFKF